MVRAISIVTGYLIRPTGPNSSEFIYLTQFDPRGKTNVQFFYVNS